MELFTNGTGYAKLFKEGVKQKITDTDLNILTRFLLDNDVIDVLRKYQSLDHSESSWANSGEDSEPLPLDDVSKMYTELISNVDEDHSEHIKFYFENFYKRKISKEFTDDLSDIQKKWSLILDWIVAETYKDSSLMIKYVENEESGEVELLDLQIIDIDTKLWTKIPDYDTEMLEFFKDYADFSIHNYIENS